MSRNSKSAILGLITALVGLIVGILPFGVSLEEDTGLSLLFRLRGERIPPPDVVVVSIDKRSSDALGLKNDPRKWARALHGELIGRVMEAGASGIVFDMFFEEPRPGSDDFTFAEAMRRSGRVILSQRLLAERAEAPDGGSIYTERLVSAVPVIENSAAAMAPFPMPKVSLSVIRNWVFKTGAGDAPTLPVVSFQFFAADAYEDFLALLRTAGAPLSSDIPSDRATLLQRGKMVHAIQEIRTAFERDTGLEARMLALLERGHQGDSRKGHLVRSLISMYSGDSRRYVNFYGPPGSIPTIPYDHMLGRGESGLSTLPDLRGRMVFVGFSELYQPEQRDTFFTVFSQKDGRDISGVELAATQFANLLEQMAVKPLGFGLYLVVILCWGLVAGITSRQLPPLIAGVTVALGSALYLYFSYARFTASGAWYPVMLPVFIQPAFAFVGGLIWRYADANRERKNIRSAFGYYLPPDVVDRLARNMSGLRTESRIVQGVCLYTDAEGYTSLAETMDSRKLGEHLNQYYEIVFGPIKKQGGTISNVIGDSVLALWLGRETDKRRIDDACAAAFEISSQMRSFEAPGGGGFGMPTRIGIHSGEIMIGNVGAADHFEYRPVGDMVNTTTRLDSINRLLGTRVLISESVAGHLDSFLVRDVGTFLLKGKVLPMGVYELVCRKDEADDKTLQSCAVFEEALSLFRQGLWEEAENSFVAYCSRFGEDGPARFYIGLCSRHRQSPPKGQWEGVVSMDYK